MFDEATVHYAANPQPVQPPPDRGPGCRQVSPCRLPFRRSSRQIQIKGKSGEVTKTVVSWVQGQDVNAFWEVVETNREQALAFAERRLRRDPRQHQLLRAYLIKVGE